MAGRGPRVVTINLSARRETDFRQKKEAGAVLQAALFCLKKSIFPIMVNHGIENAPAVSIGKRGY
jgi:hypothetical protein